MSEPVRTSRNGQILEVVLDRPKANAIDVATSRELGSVFEKFLAAPELRVAILTGGGDRFFSAGWDLISASEGEAADSDYGIGGFGGITELKDRTKPIIAAVNGMAVGGGFELVLAADFVIAAEDAQFFLPEVQRGLVADAASFRLPKRLPRALAMELLLTGRRMSAAEACDRGLINQVVPKAAVMETARSLAQEILKAAPLSIAAVMEIVRETEAMPLEACYAAMRNGKWQHYETMLKSDDAVEGPRAFAEKRDPVWTGK
ncbi:MAG: crotonobetainyl-CoA hydratase [Alphaproteobacteria bacterium]|nr:crotonobetainyl-CoA hydratase [Alphaproteobacteria bacterium]